MTANNVHIRRARPSDLEEITSIERASFPDPWEEETLAESLHYYPRTFFVAENETHIAGFVAAGLEDTGEEIYGHILNLAVEPSCRSRGVGQGLVRRVELECLLLGASGIQLEVRNSNEGARRFYAHLDYEQVFVLADYYANGEDAIVMMKWFVY
jgi:ribosomal-protein-alanine N-acetyltransferase